MKTILVTLALTVLASCNSDLKNKEAQLQLEASNKIHVGRYQYIPQSGGYINKGKLIDTATGKMWQDTCYRNDKKGECEASAWTEETVIGINNYTWSDWYKYLEVTDPKNAKQRTPSSVDAEKFEYQQVKGHIKSNGTYVAPYIRTSPNSTTYDNIRPKK